MLVQISLKAQIHLLLLIQLAADKTNCNPSKNYADKSDGVQLLTTKRAKNIYQLKLLTKLPIGTKLIS